ncbi:MAG: putative bifunctional diguanylate cyclase/phosphodiesterase [Solirubrobacteraceae bacterium]
MPRTTSTWSTQQLTEFVVTVSDAASEEDALREGVVRAAEALDADAAAIVRDGRVVASQGWPEGELPEAALVAAAAAGDGEVDLPGLGPVASIVTELGDEASARLLLCRAAAPRLQPVEAGLLRGMARTLALSLRTLRSVEVLRERQQLLEGLSGIQRAISRRAPLNDVLEMVVDLTYELLGDELPALFLRDPDDPGTLLLEACRGLDEETVAAIRRRRVGEGVAGRSVSEDRLVVVEDYASTAGSGTIQLFRDNALQAAMAAPVHENGEAVGSLLVSSWKPGRHYDADAQELLTTIAQHVSLALTDAKTVGAMVHQALHDALTGLPNRALFLDRLEHALARAVRGGSEVAVLFLDLDRFKTVNDSLGHAAGDELLCVVARRISGCMRAADTAARLGGDEFAVLLEDLVSTREAVRVAERIISALEEPIEVAGREVFVGASIGVATGSYGAEDLLRHADVAMYRAKAQGKGRYAMFEEGMQAEVIDRLELEADLQRAIDRGELEVFYQPIIALASGEMAGHEALVRWRHPTRGLLSPGGFIPVAEETGLVVPIGRFVLREACRQAAEWAATTGTDLSMNVNLSGRQLEDPALLDDVTAILRETGLPAARLVLEITETVLMHDTETTIERLRALRALGVRLAVDDFGTGYSSLRYLNRFPLDVLKMAKPFVDGLGSQEEDPALARAIIDLGANLGLTIIAEGIERSAQLVQLRRLGCPMGQGYWFARPMPADEAGRHLSAGATALL